MADNQAGPQRYRVTADYQAHYPDPLVMRAGDPVQVGQADDENPAWIWCTGPDGRSGWVPNTYLAQDGATGTALRDYAATELSVRAGDELLGTAPESGWIWATDAQGHAGWVPVTHIAPLG